MSTKHLLPALAAFTLVTLATMSLSVDAQEGPDSSADDLAKAAQNPIASLISLPLQNNTNFGLGPLDKTQNILNVQPVWPVTINENWNFITRTIVPIISQPAFTPQQSREFGIGDVNFTGFFSPSDSGTWTWGVGPTVVFPTHTDEALGVDPWRVGASFVALTMPGDWVIGALVSNIWSVGGSSADPDVNSLLIQPFVNYNFPSGKGWYLTSVPVITANWEAERSGDRWTLPLGGGIGKVFKLGTQPVNAQAQAFYNVKKPENGADWQLRLQLQFLFPR